MKLLMFLKGKLVLTVVAGFLLVGGATAVFAATPAGQTVVQSLSHASPTAKASATQGDGHTGQNNGQTKQNHAACPGLADAQNLAQEYGLNTSSQATGVMAICALHQGTFKGTTGNGTAVNTTRIYGYGEIDQLLTYAQFLASKDQAKLNDTNVSSYLAAALHSCGSTPLATCLKTNIPNFHPGNHDHHGNGNGNGNSDHPTTTPTPNGHKPSATPTPHH